MRILGIDFGDKKIGLAIGDSEARVAVPLEVIPNFGKKTLQFLIKKISIEDIAQVVVGVPLEKGGRHGPEQLNKTRAFIKKLKTLVAVPVFEEDEAYTTAESLRLQKEDGVVAKEDALAAMLIVEQYLSRK